MSGIMERKNRRGRFTLVFVSVDVVFPERYPRARCPTENVACPSLFIEGLRALIRVAKCKVECAGVFVCAIVVGPSIWSLICFVGCEVFECCF